MRSLTDVDQSRRGWGVEVDGESVDDVSGVALSNQRMGIEVEYGMRPEGYDGVVIREPGGAATIPYMIGPDGRIYVGVVTERRPTMGESFTDNIPRGFSDFKEGGNKETAEETAIREMAEETGYMALGSRLIKLAEGLNPNSTFFDYSRSPKEGVTIFGLKVEQDELEMVAREDGSKYFVFPETIRDKAGGDKVAERILGSRFVTLEQALASRDMFTSAAAGQLVAHLLVSGEYLVPQNQPTKPVEE